MKSWKTTLMGMLAAALLLTGAHISDPNKPWIDATQVPAALAVLGLGAAAKDAGVHSTIDQVEEATENTNDKSSN